MNIAASGVSLRLGGRQILRSIDLVAEPGELVGLIGANGAGKSSLLRILAGLRRPEGGEVRLGGMRLAAMTTARIAVQRAYLPQTPAVHWDLTASEIVGLGRLPHRRLAADPARDDDAVRRAIERTGTLALASRRIGTLSGGERARVLLARALAVEAPVLLADEPIAGLDPLQQIRTMIVLHELAGRGAVVIAVLHDLTIAARFCDRLILLHSGAVLADGPSASVLTDANVGLAYGVTVRRETGLVVPWEPLAPP
ncbi:MAG: ABC transporter ATP-binding protein [Acetobacteraceae bacterium]|nr:ABC transporter ATP-binding protein [Acetobacteraceae bacterium]